MLYLIGLYFSASTQVNLTFSVVCNYQTFSTLMKTFFPVAHLYLLLKNDLLLISNQKHYHSNFCILSFLFSTQNILLRYKIILDQPGRRPWMNKVRLFRFSQQSRVQGLSSHFESGWRWENSSPGCLLNVCLLGHLFTFMRVYRGPEKFQPLEFVFLSTF